MPELPEVETVRLGLLEALPGKQVTAVKVLRCDSIQAPGPEEFAGALTGHKFCGITRRGKYILFELDRGAAMVAHLRMSGRLLIVAQGKPLAKHVRVCIALNSRENLLFEDLRVFGRLWYVPKGSRVEDVVSALAELGVEPLESLSARYLKQSFANRRQAIKSALLDQTVIAGIGNIYADESLHLSGINPCQPACSLTLPESEKLVGAIKAVLEQAIVMRGSTLRNYTDSRGVNGNYQNGAWVYGREHEPCRRCGLPIKRVKIAGRSAHFCPHCQPLRRRRSSTSRR